jgi:20S proteasome alpha/beta subunit
MITDLSSNMQLGTQGYNRRPYGVGLLVAGFDDKGPHIFQVGSVFYFKQSYFIINFVFKR